MSLSKDKTERNQTTTEKSNKTILTMEEHKRVEIEKILIWIGKTANFDIISMADQIRSGKYSFSGSLSKYELSSCLKEAITVYLEGEFDASFVKIKTFLYLLAEYFEHKNTPQGFKEYANILIEIAKYIETCDNYIQEWEKKTNIEMQIAFPFYNGKVSLNAYDCLSIKKSIDNKYFHLYKYKNGGELKKTDNYKLYDCIIASNNIFNLCRNANCGECWEITVGLYLEKKIDLSYFVITFSLNGNIWVLTDKIIYKNTDQINRLRGGGRRFSEDRERCLDFLPYILIDKVIEKRKETKDISKNNSSELWIFPFKEFFSENIYFIIKYTIQKIQSDYVIKNLIGIDNETHLLTNGNIDISDDSNFVQINVDELNKIANEIYGKTTKALALTNKSLIEQLGVSTELMTVEEVKKNIQYLAHKQVVENHEREKWGDLIDARFNIEKYKEYNTQRSQLMQIFKSKSKEMEKYLFVGDRIFIHDVNHPYIYSGFSSEKRNRFEKDFVSHTTSFGSVLGDVCFCCGKHKVKKEDYYKSFEFFRYTEILAILGVEREILPPLFRDYIAHYALPYIGNPILDNVKPEFCAIENDYVSKHNPNGFLVSYSFCGICRNRLYKKYKIANEAIIVISSKKNKVIEIISKDNFLDKYNINKTI